MAALRRISTRQLQRVFKSQFLCTPSHWLRELQCRQGKDLIAKGYSSKAAAAELKFATAAHFCRVFKKQFGVTPRSFAPPPLIYSKYPQVSRNGGEPMSVGGP